MEQMKCSVCPNKIAINESINNPGTFYCSSCSNYIAMEYGITCLKPLPEELDTSSISWAQERFNR